MSLFDGVEQHPLNIVAVSLSFSKIRKSLEKIHKKGSMFAGKAHLRESAAFLLLINFYSGVFVFLGDSQIIKAEIHLQTLHLLLYMGECSWSFRA